MTDQRRPPVGLLLLLVLCCLLVGCGGGNQPSAGPTTTASTPPSTATASSTGGAAPTTTAGFAGTLVQVRVSGGQVQTAQRRVRVTRGHQVRIRVDSDQADEVHVHGYDLTRPVGPGKPATIDFTAELPGVFEVELEQAKRTLVELEVR